MTRYAMHVLTILLSATVLLTLLLAGCGSNSASSRLGGVASESHRLMSARPNAARQAQTQGMARRALSGTQSNRTGLVSSISPEDELWVIAKPSADQEKDAGEEVPGGGSMIGTLAVPSGEEKPAEAENVPLPLKHTDVSASILGYIANVNVTQQFHNPYDSKIEAKYVFPLPQNAAVNDFIMTIGERRIRGIIREREEAEKIYEQAKHAGHVASLLTQERANIFTQSVANIEPGRQIDVDITYFHTLTYVDGWYEWVFPMVVGPRFNPPGTTDGIGAVAYGDSGISGQSTEVSYLRPNQRSGHDISLSVDLNAGVGIEEIYCLSHQTNISRSSSVNVALSPEDSIPNKDFVLRYKVAGDHLKANMLTQRDERGGYFTLMLYPPAELKSIERAPVEMVFVLDCSGSMSGEPITKAKRAVTRAIGQLNPSDTFQVIRFSNNASQLGSAPLSATRQNIKKGIRYVQNLSGGGGTMMIEGIKAALDFPHQEGRTRYVVFLTDGYIGNERDILAAIHEKLGDSRIFSFGIGSSVNRFLMERMAKIGRGAVAYVGPGEKARDVMDLFTERVKHPALSNITIDWGGLHVHEVFPNRLPDMFVGRPVILTGRYKGDSATTVRVNGRLGSREIEIPIHVEPADQYKVDKALPSVWARMHIADLMDRGSWTGMSEVTEKVKTLALSYNLMSAYTSFVAVDTKNITAGEFGTTVNVGVPVPEGVMYETTVHEDAKH